MPHRPLGRARRATRTVRAVRGLVALVATVAVFGVPTAALGHAELDSITPADKSTVATAPSTIVAVFTEQLDPSKSSLTLVDASGKVIAQGGTVDPNQTLTLNLDPATVVPGTYTVRWISASDEDGDIARGTTSFTVAAAPPSASPTPAPSQGASVGASESPSPVPSVAASPSPSASPAPTTPTSSTTDAIIPIVVALIVLAAIGAWLLRGRGRAAR
jgi:methionine-rich copper-binding protein CopC